MFYSSAPMATRVSKPFKWACATPNSPKSSVALPPAIRLSAREATGFRITPRLRSKHRRRWKKTPITNPASPKSLPLQRNPPPRTRTKRAWIFLQILRASHILQASRMRPGSAEVDLFFDWTSDMILTLQRVDAVVARLQSELPPTAKIETHRLTFATFPILGYSLTSDTIPQNKLWEIATYDLKPRVNRLDGVASVLIQGGRVPEFQVMPEPARLLAAGVTVNDILDAIRRTNLIDSHGLIENNHQLVLGLIS